MDLAATVDNGSTDAGTPADCYIGQDYAVLNFCVTFDLYTGKQQGSF